ncbi:uncharacterized protein EAE97_001754 [Botrytis byssoidea]|uniref:Uncharacterized protein n=1 Tax=Botrytis byssoidea TaxID=139641 RepID=A0A9P5IYE4_9HELO|nr:uncharacterized protein EAE97_001754 [Botrytis byssoidea]KAF7952257.1 hypothetical protein EAE97_001754 [Botrytis byssoidea]
MDDFLDTTGIDLNNKSNLSIYIQLITFRKGSADEIVIDVREDSQVETARCLSKRLDFRFRYAYDTRKATITRNSSLHTLEVSDLYNYQTDLQGSFYHDLIIDTGDSNMDVSISAYQDFLAPLPEFSGDFDAFAQDMGLSDERSANMQLNDLDLDNNTFGTSTNFQIEYNGDENLPDWFDLVNIVDQDHFDPDTNMLDDTRLDNSIFENAHESSESLQLVIDTPVTSGIQNSITDIPAWRDTPSASVAVLDIPTPRPLSPVEPVHSVPSKNSQSQGIDIVVKPILNRSDSSLGNTPSSFQEGVFSSTPGCSSMQTTYGSSPHRMGPLDSATRAKANAVKAIGACWRCKFLRKPCDAQNCCIQCKGKQGGPWHSVGCKRGDIKKKMLPISLCSETAIQTRDASTSEIYKPWLSANQCRIEISKRRKNDLRPEIMNASRPTKVGQFLQNLASSRPLAVDLQRNRSSLLARFKDTAPAVLEPLDDCILTILWGFLNCESAEKALHPWIKSHNGTIEDFILLLHSAAIYQASFESNQLIAYSLTCLRTCVEALHIYTLGGFENSHEACESSVCKVDCIRDLELQIEQYLDELSRVIFLKENMRNRFWWLSAFYSLCIQGVVRQALVLLSSNDHNETSRIEKSSSAQYLHIAIRLFSVSSGTHDPLIQDWSSQLAFSSAGIGAPSVEDYQNAQSAINQSQWKLQGINKSGNYLKRLFEDNGGPLAEPHDESVILTILPEPYLPKAFTLETCSQLRADWDLARCNYTKNLLQIVKDYGHSSKAYTDAEEKWGLVEAEWKRVSDEAMTNTVNQAHNGRETSKPLLPER